MLKIAAAAVIFIFLLLNVIIYNYTYKVVFPVTTGQLPKPRLSRWEKIKAFFGGVNIYKTKISAWPARPYVTVTLPAKDGYAIEGWLIQPDSNRRVHKTVILVPGIRNTKSTLIPAADFFNNLGYSCLLIDLRGTGGSTGDKCSFGIDEAGDVNLAYQYISALYPGCDIILWGESMGAVSILRAVHYYKLRPARLILEKPFDHFQRAVRKSIDYFSDGRLPSGFLAGLCTFWISWHINHWAFNHNASLYADSVACPVLLQLGDMDKITDGQQVNNIYRHIPVHEKSIERYALSGHRESLCTTEPEHWERVVGAFLK